eukprot:7770339-Pyramimonas_sp.AAC.1
MAAVRVRPVRAKVAEGGPPGRPGQPAHLSNETKTTVRAVNRPVRTLNRPAGAANRPGQPAHLSHQPSLVRQAYTQVGSLHPPESPG